MLLLGSTRSSGESTRLYIGLRLGTGDPRASAPLAGSARAEPALRLNVAAPKEESARAKRKDLTHSILPSEVHAEVVVEPPVVRLEVLLQPTPDRRVHLLILARVALPLELRGFGLPLR